MRIDDTYGRLNDIAVKTAKQTGAATPKADADDSKASTTAGGDAVTVSAQAMQLAEKAAAQADASKVEKLRAAIEGGTFKIDHQAITRRIVDGG
jgi:flagellar biosynthesis anti-sigma factor FlgM